MQIYEIRTLILIVKQKTIRSSFDRKVQEGENLEVQETFRARLEEGGDESLRRVVWSI